MLLLRSRFLAPLSVSQVKYKAKRQQKAEGSVDLPNLLQLEHALHASRLQSNVGHLAAVPLLVLRRCHVWWKTDSRIIGVVLTRLLGTFPEDYR